MTGGLTIIWVLLCLFIDHINVFVTGTFPNRFRLIFFFSVFFFFGWCCKVDPSTLVRVAKCPYSPAIGDAILLLSPVNIHVYVIKGPPVEHLYLLAVGVMKSLSYTTYCLGNVHVKEVLADTQCTRAAPTFRCPHWSVSSF